MAIPSIQPDLLRLMAGHTAKDIYKVVINNTYETKAFFIKESNENYAVLEYIIPASSGLTAITSISLLTESDEILTYANVYVDNAYDIQITQKITYTEGI